MDKLLQNFVPQTCTSDGIFFLLLFTGSWVVNRRTKPNFGEKKQKSLGVTDE